MKRKRKRQCEMVRLDRDKISDRLILREMLRSELLGRAAIGPSSLAKAMGGQEIGMRIARGIAKALRCRVVDLVPSFGPSSDLAKLAERGTRPRSRPATASAQKVEAIPA